MEDIREVHILKNAELRKWAVADFSEIKKGDIFRVFESTGEQVFDKSGNSEFIAKSYPYMTEDGVLGIDVIPYRRVKGGE